MLTWVLQRALSMDDGRLFTADPGEVGRAAIRNGSGMHVEYALIAIGLLLTVMSTVSLAIWIKRQKVRPHRLVVFNRIARRMGLTWRDRLVLWRVGRRTGLPTPLAMMLCPGTMGTHARSYARSATFKRHGTLTLARVASIRRHVFGV